MNILLAMPPPMPLPAKVIITIAMVCVMFLFARLRGARRPLLPAMRRAALIALAIVIALEITFPDSYQPGLDNTGVLAALIGLVVGGLCASLTQKHRPQQTESPADDAPHADA